jgi:hypothetical protein
MKKQLNVDLIQSELRGGSAFFPGYQGSHPPHSPSKGPEKVTSGDTARARITKEKRAIRTRHPFDIYEDQYLDLRKLALERQIKGIKCSMSQMVREALDIYLSTQKQ